MTNTSSKRKRGKDRKARNSGNSAAAASVGGLSAVTYPFGYDTAAIKRHAANVVSIPCYFSSVFLLYYILFLQNAYSIHRNLAVLVGLVQRTSRIIKRRFVQGKPATSHFQRL